MHLRHESVELLEQIASIVGARTRFGVVLHTEGRHLGQTDALHHRVVEVDMGHLGLTRA